MIVRRRRRSGQILFLEFMITLPIFAMLLMSMTVFHIYYLQTGQMHGMARNSAWIMSQRHLSGRQPPPGFRAETYPHRDGLQRAAALRVNPAISTQTELAVSTRTVYVPRYLGNGEAVGRVEMNQDSWANQEVQRKGKLANVNQAFLLKPFTPRLTDGAFQTPIEAAMKEQAQWLQEYGRPSAIGREFAVESAATLFYSEEFKGQDRQLGMLGL